MKTRKLFFIAGLLAALSYALADDNVPVGCDFGWGGNSNGYYVSGIFKLNDSDVELDSGSQYCKTTNYNNYLHVITY